MKTTIKRVVSFAFGFVLLGSAFSQVAQASGAYQCPAPNTVHCVPAKTSFGAWTANGGEMTGNSFAPNLQCANVLPLPNGESRLFCCYTKCGVFTQDVASDKCVKVDQGHFRCR